MIKCKGVEYCKQKWINLTSFEANDDSESFSSMVGSRFGILVTKSFKNSGVKGGIIYLATWPPVLVHTHLELALLERGISLTSAEACFVLFSLLKRVYMYWQEISKSAVTVNGQKLKAVDKFTYLGSTLSRSVHINYEVDTRIAKASSAFGRLRSLVWERKGISLSTKLSVYRAIVLTTLLYACETWTVYQRHEKKLNRFHLNCLHKLLRVKWHDQVPDTEILEQTGMPSVFTMLRQSQLRWAGYVTRMSDERLPKRVLYGELLAGARSHGGQKKRFKDTLKTSLKDFGIDHNSWETLAQDRTEWRGAISKGAAAHEAHAQRITTAKLKRVSCHRQSPTVTTSCHWTVLPPLSQNLQGTDWPHQPSPHPPNPTDGWCMKMLLFPYRKDEQQHCFVTKF